MLNIFALHEDDVIFMLFVQTYTEEPVCYLANYMSKAVYTNYFYDTSIIFSNFVITYREPFTGPTLFARVMTDRPM